MAQVSKEEISQARSLPLSGVLLNCGLERDPNDTKQFKSKAFRISINGQKWYDHNNSRGGGGAIDLVIHLEQCNFTQAIKYLTGIDIDIDEPITVRSNVNKTQPPEPKPQNNNIVFEYLTERRGIDGRMVEWLINKGMLYADGFKNCVFRYGVGAELRGTNSTKWQRCYGKISEPFLIPANSIQLVLTESAIDALSFRQLNNGVAVASIAGANRYELVKKVQEYAQKHKQIVVCGFDSDQGGDESYEHLKGMGIYCRVRPNSGKDWNESLLSSFP